jgi:hypothetical protein
MAQSIMNFCRKLKNWVVFAWFWHYNTSRNP